MTQHTPGPWKAQRDIRHWSNDGALTSGSPKAWAVYGPYRVCAIESGIGIAWNRDAEAEANARLIAAAPTLLAALRRTLDYLEVFAEEAEGEALEATGRDIEQVQAAITAATGETFTTGQALNGVAP